MQALKNHIPGQIALTPFQNLKTVVESCSVYALNPIELNVFETYQTTQQVGLLFNDMVLTTMLRGKKVMYLPQKSPFDYIPGESVLVQPNEKMVIDFPEATTDHPSQCLALAINGDCIRRTVDLLNERFPKAESGDQWLVRPDEFHFSNSLEITDTIDKLVRICREDTPVKDLLAEVATQELLIRLMQTQARSGILRHYRQISSRNRFAHVVQYIHQNLSAALSVAELAAQACMSEPTFYRTFKRELGVTPLEFILTERLRIARKLLSSTDLPIVEVAGETGFASVHHFHAMFKRAEGITPGSYRERFRVG